MLTRHLLRPVISPLVRGVTQRTRGKMPLVLGPELVVNGNPLAASGWTVSGTDATHLATFSNGKLTFQSDTTSPQLQLSQVILTVGKLYRVEFVISARVGTGTMKTDALGSAGVASFGTVDTHIRQGVAIQTGFNLTRALAGVNATFDKISVREVLSGG